VISTKIISQAAELKVLVRRTMSQEDRESAVRCCNGILAEAERVAGLERETLRPGASGQAEGATR
jgi:hypothetical protein